MKRSKLIETRDALRELVKTEGPAKWQYAIAKNLKKAESTAEAYPQGDKIMADYEKTRTALCIASARKDDKGQPVLIDGPVKQGRPSKEYDIADRPVFDAELAKLTAATNAKFEDLAKFMDEDDKEASADNFWHKVKLENFPASVKNMDKILDLVEE